MYGYATVQPHILTASRPRDKTTFLTSDEKIELCVSIDSREHEGIPACIDHANGEKSKNLGSFVVPPNLVVGRTVDAFVRGNKAAGGNAADLIFLFEVFWDNEEATKLHDSYKRGDRWGVSLCTDLEVYPDLGLVKSKKITHVGITRDPEFGPENSFIHGIFTSYQSLEQDVYEKFVKNDPHAVLPPRLRKRLQERYGKVAVAKVQAAASSAIPDIFASGRLNPAASRNIQSDWRNHMWSQPLPRPTAFFARFASYPTKMAAQDAPAAPNLAELGRMTADIDLLMASFGDKPEEQIYTSENLGKVSNLHKNLTGFLRDNNLSDFGKAPPGTLMRYAQLESFLANTGHLMDTYVDKAGVKAEADTMKSALRESMLNGTSQQPLSIATQVLAFANHALTNQRALERQLLTAQGEHELTKNELKRVREEKVAEATPPPPTKKAKTGEDDKEAQLPDAVPTGAKVAKVQGAASHGVGLGPGFFLNGMRDLVKPDRNFLQLSSKTKSFSGIFDLPQDDKLRLQTETLMAQNKI